MTHSEAAVLNTNDSAPEAHQAPHCATLLMVTWVFTFMAMVGLAGETLQHYLAFDGELESRAGFIWGPFSPIYGLAALLLTLIAMRLGEVKGKKYLLVFFIAALVGGGLEYFASWAMETYWGVVAWSYLDNPLNFDGRTDILHMVIWGTLGLAWVAIGYPLVKKVFAKVNTTSISYQVITWVLFVFIIIDSIATIAVLQRADARTHGVEATTPLEQAMDEYYPNEVLQARFHNMGGIGRP